MVRCLGEDGKLYAEMTPEEAERLKRERLQRMRDDGESLNRMGEGYFEERYYERHDDD